MENLETQNEVENKIDKDVQLKDEQIEKLKKIKTCALWQIFGFFLFFIPGFIAMIFLVINLFSYNAQNKKESNSTLRIISAILSIFTLIVGPIVAIVWANNEIEWLKNN